MTNAAATGTTKNTTIAASAGAMKSQPAYDLFTFASSVALAIEHPAPFLEDAIGACIQFCGGALSGEFAMDHTFNHQAHFRGDALPFGHFRRGTHTLELIVESTRVGVARERGIVPGRTARRQVAGYRVKAPLHLRPRQILDDAQRSVLHARAPKHHQARAARDRCTWPV